MFPPEIRLPEKKMDGASILSDESHIRLLKLRDIADYLVWLVVTTHMKSISHSYVAKRPTHWAGMGGRLPGVDQDVCQRFTIDLGTCVMDMLDRIQFGHGICEINGRNKQK